MDEALLDKARRHLARRDARLKPLIKTIGKCSLHVDPDHFHVLVRSIIGQQISTKAAHAIGQRLRAALGERVEPKAILDAAPETLRGVGLSSSKQAALRDLAQKCHEGQVELSSLHLLSDEEVIAELLPVRGIGRWTAEMFLIFSLGRADVLPVADYGLRAGAAKVYELPELPGKPKLEELAECWRPYRSIGTWYIWRSLGFVPQSKEQA